MESSIFDYNYWKNEADHPFINVPVKPALLRHKPDDLPPTDLCNIRLGSRAWSWSINACLLFSPPEPQDYYYGESYVYAPVKLPLPAGRKAVAVAVGAGMITVITNRTNRTEVYAIGSSYSSFRKSFSYS